MNLADQLSRRHVIGGSAALLAALALGGLGAGCTDDDHGKDHARADRAGAADARTATNVFYAGVPLVVTERTWANFAQLAGVNRLLVTPGLVNPTAKNVVAPNRDTVYALASLDLRGGPLMLTLPDIPDRYHVFQFLDAWMGGFGLVGTRTTGGHAGTWVITRAGERRPIPAGAHRLECPTSQAIILGRIRAIDDADAKIAAAVGRQAQLAPIGTAPPVSPPAKPTGAASAVGSNGPAFFDELGDALEANPPVTAQQRDAVTAAASLGLGAGRHPTVGATTSRLDLFRRTVTDGLRSLERVTLPGSHQLDGWTYNLELGGSDTDTGLLERAVIARYFWGPVPAAEAVYPHVATADDGNPLNGSKRYRIHFPPGQLPPVDAFWSLTVYGPDMFLVPNPANRYSLSGDTPGLVHNPDGSLDIYLQHDPPPGHEANWLPVPTGAFNLHLRLYLPRRPILDGTYRYPPVEVVH